MGSGQGVLEGAAEISALRSHTGGARDESFAFNRYCQL